MIKISRKTLFCLSVAAIAAMTGCSSQIVKPKHLETIIPATSMNGRFCEHVASSSMRGGGMFKLDDGRDEFIGSCHHIEIAKTGIVLMVFGDNTEDLGEDLDYYIDPSSYYTQDELNELNCVAGSHCANAKLAKAEDTEVKPADSGAATPVVAGDSGQAVDAGAPEKSVVQFDTNSTEPKDSALLDRVSKDVAGKKVKIVVVGHTDSVGSNKYNDGLAIRRAERVKQILIAKGVDAEIIKVSGKGKKDPVAENKTSAGRALNRRAEIKGVVDGNGN